MKKLRVGVIGLGFIGRAHVDALRRLPGGQVTAVVELVDLAQARGVPVAVNFNHRGFSQVQHARAQVAAGQLGDVHTVRGTYLQDWLLFDSDWSWRLDPSAGGLSRAVADIGSHWMDLAQHVSGARIVEVMADLATVLPVHYKPHGTLQTFARAANGLEVDGHARSQGTRALTAASNDPVRA